MKPTSGALMHEEALELAGLYVLGALDEVESAAVRRHLAECPEPHAEFAELGGAAQALVLAVEPIDAPPTARDRLLAAVSAEPRAAHAEKAPSPVISLASERARRRPWFSWAAAAAAVLVIAVLGVWNVQLQERASQLEQRADLIASAIAASAAAGAEVALLQGEGPAAGAAGFAAFPQGETGYILLVGLPEAPSDQVYQAWYLVDGAAQSAGLLDVGDDGYAVLGGVPPVPGMEVIALTVEPAGGSDQPTSAPIVAGQLGS